MKKETHTFRANAAALIKKDSKILAFQRVDFPDTWQCPQGGIDVGETPEQTVWREIAEETGLQRTDLELIAEYPDWLTYPYPEAFRKKFGFLGQTQRWFLFEFVGEESSITPDESEFHNWTWLSIDELVEKVPTMKRTVFETLQNWVELQ